MIFGFSEFIHYMYLYTSYGYWIFVFSVHIVSSTITTVQRMVLRTQYVILVTLVKVNAGEMIMGKAVAGEEI